MYFHLYLEVSLGVDKKMMGYRCGWCGFVNVSVKSDRNGNFNCRWCGKRLNVTTCDMDFTV